MKPLITLLLLTALLGAAFAEDVGATVTSINCEIIINSDLGVDEYLTLSAFNKNTVSASYIYIFLSDMPDDLKITDENKTLLNYTSFVANGIYTVRLLDNLPSNSSRTYTLAYSNDNIVKDFSGSYVFSYLFTSYYQLDDFSLKMVLPTGFGITQKDINTISPPSSRIFSDGQQIIIEWAEGINYLETKTYLVFFERIAFGNFSIIWVILSGLIGALLGGAAVYLFLKKKRKEIVTMALTTDEKNVVDFILKNENNAFQNDVGGKLDFSKPKLSKIVHNLEEKNILKVVPSGRKNKLSINKKVL